MITTIYVANQHTVENKESFNQIKKWLEQKINCFFREADVQPQVVKESIRSNKLKKISVEDSTLTYVSEVKDFGGKLSTQNSEIRFVKLELIEDKRALRIYRNENRFMNFEFIEHPVKGAKIEVIKL